MAARLIPAAAVTDSWTTVNDALGWAGVSAAVWERFATALGDAALQSLLTVAGMDENDFKDAFGAMTPRANAVEKTNRSLLLTAIKHKFQVPCRLLEAQTSEPIAAAVTTKALEAVAAQTPKVKLAQIVDQAKDVEVPMMATERLKEMRKRYQALIGDGPEEDAEVTDAQLFALAYLVEHNSHHS